MTDQPHSEIARRLKRANGHLETIIEMIGQGRPCAEIAQQLQAVLRDFKLIAKYL